MNITTCGKNKRCKHNVNFPAVSIKSSLTSLPERILENIATFVKFSCRLCNSFVEFKPNTFVNSKSANAIDITVVKDAGGSVFLPEGVCSKDFQ
jgi:hypothetical protein